MIVVDENIHDQRIIAAISAWYPGRVISITRLRLRSLIKDDAIPALLRKVPKPTFVTINVADFWKKIPPDSSYCFVNVALPKECTREIPDLIRRFLRHPSFKTKTLRMGKIVRLTPTIIEYYEERRRLYSVPLPE